MAAPPIPPIRLGLIGTGLAVEKLHWPALRRLADRYEVTAFTDSSAAQSRRFADYSGVGPARAAADRAAVPVSHLYEVARDALTAGIDADQAAAFLALAVGHPDRTFAVGENVFYRDDLRYARALLDGGAIGRLHLMTWRHAGRLVPREDRFTGTPRRQRPQYRGGVHRIAQIRLLHGDIARVHGAVQAANSTIDAPSDLALNLVFTGGAIGNHTASYPEIPVPPEPDATTHTTVFRGIDNGYRAELVDFADAVQFGLRAGRQRRAERGQRDGRPAGSRLRGTGGRTGTRPRARRGPGTAVAAPWLDRAVRRAARTTHQQFGVFRRMNDPQRGTRLAVPAVATSLRR
jgi:predicted dehydrogenase